MAEFDREASRVRRDEIERRCTASVDGYAWSHSVTYDDVRALVADSHALESLLVAADREVAELRAKIAAVTALADETAAWYDPSEQRVTVNELRAALAAVVSVEAPASMQFAPEVDMTPDTDDLIPTHFMPYVQNDCTCLPYAAGGDGPEIDCPVHGEAASGVGENEETGQ